MLRILFSLGLIALFIYIGVGLLLYATQRSFIYFPQADPSAQEHDSLMLEVPDATLHLSVSLNQRQQAIIYFGGNAEAVALNMPAFNAAFPAHDLYFVHYRGYGQSSGQPTQDALFADALAVFDYVKQQPYRRITVIGRSLGSGVATYLASQRPVSELSLVTPYNSLLELAQQHYPVYPAQWLLKDKYESWRYAEDVTVPVNIVVAENDRVIPRHSSLALRDHFPPHQVTWHELAGTGHNDISHHPNYYASLIHLPGKLAPVSQTTPVNPSSDSVPDSNP